MSFRICILLKKTFLLSNRCKKCWPGDTYVFWPALHCRIGVRTLIVAEGEKWPNVVERRREEIVWAAADAAFRSANLAPFNGLDGLLLAAAEKC